MNWEDIKGHEGVIERVRLAAKEHCVILIRRPQVPGVMIARRLVLDLPDVAGLGQTYSAAGLTGRLPVPEDMMAPFRAPHHTVSIAGLIGTPMRTTRAHRSEIDNHWPSRPGEVALAHGGVLLLDELPEFSRRAVEAIGDCVKCGTDFGLFQSVPRVIVATANHCPCGELLVNPRAPHYRECRCTAERRIKYEVRLSSLLKKLNLPVVLAVGTSADLSTNDMIDEAEQIMRDVEGDR